MATRHSCICIAHWSQGLVLKVCVGLPYCCPGELVGAVSANHCPVPHAIKALTPLVEHCHLGMLQRPPTRIELRSEDTEEVRHSASSFEMRTTATHVFSWPMQVQLQAQKRQADIIATKGNHQAPVPLAPVPVRANANPHRRELRALCVARQHTTQALIFI